MARRCRESAIWNVPSDVPISSPEDRELSLPALWIRAGKRTLVEFRGGDEGPVEFWFDRTSKEPSEHRVDPYWGIRVTKLFDHDQAASSTSSFLPTYVRSLE